MIRVSWKCLGALALALAPAAHPGTPPLVKGLLALPGVVRDESLPAIPGLVRIGDRWLFHEGAQSGAFFVEHPWVVTGAAQLGTHLRLWDTGKRRLVREVDAGASCWRIAISPDERTVFAGHADPGGGPAYRKSSGPAVTAWCPEDGSLRTLGSISGPAALAFSPRGTHAAWTRDAAGPAAATVQGLARDAGPPVLVPIRGAPGRLCLSDDAAWLASRADGAVELWKVGETAPRRTLAPGGGAPHARFQREWAVAFSPSARLLAVAQADRVEVRSVETGALTTTCPWEGCEELQFLDETHLALVSEPGTFTRPHEPGLNIVDLASGTWKSGHLASGMLIARRNYPVIGVVSSGMIQAFDADGRARADLSSPRWVSPGLDALAPSGERCCVNIGGGSTFLVGAGTAAPTPLTPLIGDARLAMARFSQDGRRLFGVVRPGETDVVLDLDRMAVLARLPGPPHTQYLRQVIRFAGDHLVCSEGQDLVTRSAATGKERRRFPPPFGDIMLPVVSPSGRWAVLLDRLVDLDAGTSVTLDPGGTATRYAYHNLVALFSDGERALAHRYGETTSAVVRLPSLEVIRELPGALDSILPLALSTQETLAAAQQGRGGPIRVWNVQTGAVRGEVDPGDVLPTAVFVDEASSTLVIAEGAGKRISLWELPAAP